MCQRLVLYQMVLSDCPENRSLRLVLAEKQTLYQTVLSYTPEIRSFKSAPCSEGRRAHYHSVKNVQVLGCKRLSLIQENASLARAHTHPTRTNSLARMHTHTNTTPQNTTHTNTPVPTHIVRNHCRGQQIPRGTRCPHTR
jgi:hypothetical protein